MLWKSITAYVSSLGWWGWIMTVGFLSGVGGLVADAAFGVGPLHMPLWAWLILIIVTAALAPFIAFHKLHQKHLLLVDRLEGRRADFIGEIAIVGIMKSVSGLGAYVTVHLQVSNRGEPSAIPKWGVRADLPNGKTLYGENWRIEAPTVLPGDPPGSTMIISPNDGIYHKAAVPIPRGGFVVGVLLSLFRDVQQRDLEFPGTKFVVDFCDIEGRPFSCSYELRYGQGPRDESMSVVGDGR
jgi:hypothetical protein